MRETGYEAWHSDPVGVLSASQRSLRVYHTPQMQAVVMDQDTAAVDFAQSRFQTEVQKGDLGLEIPRGLQRPAANVFSRRGGGEMQCAQFCGAVFVGIQVIAARPPPTAVLKDGRLV